MSVGSDAAWMVVALVALPVAVGLLIALLAWVFHPPPRSEDRDGTTGGRARRDD